MYYGCQDSKMILEVHWRYMKMTKVTVNKELCIGCGACTGIAADVFQFADDGKAEAVAPVTADNEASVEEAVAGCPVQAIEAE